MLIPQFHLFKRSDGRYSLFGRKLIIGNLVITFAFIGSILFVSQRTFSLQQFTSGAYGIIFLIQFMMFCAVALSSLPIKIKYPLLAAMIFSQCHLLLNSLFAGTLPLDNSLKATATLCVLMATLLFFVGGANWLQETHERSIGDKLTGLFNRRYFETAVEHFLNSQDRHNTPGCLLSLNINEVKSRDRVAVYASDAQLVASVADVLKESTRASDMVCRSGNEAFQALLVGSDINNARQVSARILNGIKSNSQQSGCEVDLSIGITSLIPSDDVASLKTRVEKAIDCAKQLGKTQVVTV